MPSYFGASKPADDFKSGLLNGKNTGRKNRQKRTRRKIRDPARDNAGKRKNLRNSLVKGDTEFFLKLLAFFPFVDKFQHKLLDITKPFFLKTTGFNSDITEMPTFPHIACHIFIAMGKRKTPAIL